jgi:hypothetical protein
MNYGTTAFSFDPHSDNWRPDETPRLAKQLRNASHFLHGLLVQLRFGELTRAPLRLLRLNILGENVKCDWVARAPDPWDDDLTSAVRSRHATLQTLRDAIDVRALLFATLPSTQTAHLRVYREFPNDPREIVILGSTQRNDHSSRSVHSLVMRAKILGFRFHLDGDELRKIQIEEQYPPGGPAYD